MFNWLFRKKIQPMSRIQKATEARDRAIQDMEAIASDPSKQAYSPERAYDPGEYCPACHYEGFSQNPRYEGGIVAAKLLPDSYFEATRLLHGLLILPYRTINSLETPNTKIPIPNFYKYSRLLLICQCGYAAERRPMNEVPMDVPRSEEKVFHNISSDPLFIAAEIIVETVGKIDEGACAAAYIGSELSQPDSAAWMNCICTHACPECVYSILRGLHKKRSDA